MRKLVITAALMIATIGAAAAQAPAAEDPHHPSQAGPSAAPQQVPQSPASPGQASREPAQSGQATGRMMPGPMMHGMQGMMQGMMKSMQGMMHMMRQQTSPGPMDAGRMPQEPMRSSPPQAGMMMNCPMMSGMSQETVQGMLQMMQGMTQMMQALMQAQLQLEQARGGTP